MSPEYEKKLEERIHRELMKAPDRAAPETLVVSVMAKVHAQAKLEEAINRELANLPERAAPETLVTSVLQKIEERASRPWWRRPIPQWPRKNQLVFVVTMLALVCGAVFGLSLMSPQQVISDIPTQAAAAMEPVRPVWMVLEAVTRAAGLLVGSLSQPWLLGLGLGILFVYLSCVGMGMAWYRVTFQKPRLAHA